MSSRYDYSQALRLKDLSNDHHCKKFDLSVAPYRKGKRARAIAVAFLKLVTTDAIENNTVFISPNKDSFSLSIREKSQKSISHILKKISKAYTTVDLIKSDGKIYEFMLYQKGIPGRCRTLRIGYSDYQKLITEVNNGKRYSGMKVKKAADYMEQLQTQFPKENEKVLAEVVNLFCHNIVKALKMEKDVRIRTPKVKMTIYKQRMYKNEKIN